MEEFVRKGHEGVKFFVGPEVEKTPAADKRTLFVVGLQDTSIVERLAREHRTPHIFLSANRSFDSVEETDPGVFMVGSTLVSDWEKQIHHLLDKGFMVSLDYPAHKHELVLRALNPGIWQSRNFVPILSVAIPKVNTSSVNLTIKIDDSNFAATNDGVWCMNHHEVTDSNRFTSWNEYKDDMILTDEGAIATTNIKERVEQTTPVTENISETTDMLEVSVPKNDGDLGLDTKSTSALKADPHKEEVARSLKTANDVADAYAEGATEDKLGKDTPKKSKVAKKAE